jgi:hypothetical protein
VTLPASARPVQTLRAAQRCGSSRAEPNKLKLSLGLTREIEEVIIPANDDAFVGGGILAQSGVGGFGKSGLKDMLAIDAFVAKMNGERCWQLVRSETSRGLKDDVIGLVRGVINSG